MYNLDFRGLRHEMEACIVYTFDLMRMYNLDFRGLRQIFNFFFVFGYTNSMRMYNLDFRGLRPHI